MDQNELLLSLLKGTCREETRNKTEEELLYYIIINISQPQHLSFNVYMVLKAASLLQ